MAPGALLRAENGSTEMAEHHRHTQTAGEGRAQQRAPLPAQQHDSQNAVGEDFRQPSLGTKWVLTLGRGSHTAQAALSHFHGTGMCGGGAGAEEAGRGRGPCGHSALCRPSSRPAQTVCRQRGQGNRKRVGEGLRAAAQDATAGGGAPPRPRAKGGPSCPAPGLRDPTHPVTPQAEGLQQDPAHAHPPGIQACRDRAWAVTGPKEPMLSSPPEG